MPNDGISDTTLKRLQRIAVPLVDTIDSVIQKLLDAYEAQQADRPIASAGQPRNILEDGTMEFDAGNLPSLSFTTPIQMTIDGEALPKGEIYWNTLMYKVIGVIAAKGTDAGTIYKMLAVANAAVGRKEDNGYKYLTAVGVSVQGQDANGAFREVHNLATRNGIKIAIWFNWQNNEKAAFPNRRGLIEF